MVKRKNNEEIVLSCLGGSATGVTGSCWSVSYPKKNGERGLFLIELGLIQGANTVLEEYNENKKMLSNIPMEHAEFVFITHPHQDHEGNLPALIPGGFKGKIISSYEVLEISKKLLIDSAYIHKKNIEYLNSKGKKSKPLYLEKDVYTLFDMFESYEVGVIHEINEYVSFRLRNNSHVFSALQIEIIITKPSGLKKTIVYTGDLGSPCNKGLQPFLKETDMARKSNLLIIEGTYGCSERCFTKEQAVSERADLKKTIEKFLREGNRVFIPSFSFSRMQNMMCMFYDWWKDEEWFKEFPIIVDSKLANDINSIYLRILKDNDKSYFNDVMTWRNFKFIRDYQGTTAVLSKRVPGVYLASSGMISAGHSLIYAKNFLGCSKDAMLFVGYCGDNTVGNKILNENERIVTIDGSSVVKSCYIKKYNTFSSHAQQSDLINYMKHINCDKIIIHHSSKDAKEELRSVAREALYKEGKTTQVVGVDKDYQVTL